MEKYLNDILSPLLRGMMDRFPNEITICDYRLDRFYKACVKKSEFIAPTFQQITVRLAEWIPKYGLDHISFSLWGVKEDGKQFKLYDLSSNEVYYNSIYGYLQNRSVTIMGAVEFKEGKIVPLTVIDDYLEVYRNEILFRFWKDAPVWYIPSMETIYTRRDLEDIYRDNKRMAEDFLNPMLEEPDLKRLKLSPFLK